MTRVTTFGLAVVAALLVSAPVEAGRPSQGAQLSPGAQDPSSDARWLPWIGCWRPVNQRAPEEGVHICVVPAGAGARIMTIAGDRSVVDETIIPDGATRQVEESACRGSRRSTWSADGQRVYSRAELTCDGQPARHVSGLSALTADAEWIDIQVVTAGSQENVRVRRYQRSSDRPPDPSLISDDLAARAARIALGTQLSIDQIMEASANVTPRVLEALVFETKAHFPLDSRQLIALDDAGVPDTVIDLMVAFSFPKKFEVKRSGGGSFSGGGFGGFGGLGGFGWGDFGADQYYDPYYSFFSPFGYNSWTHWDGYYYGPGTGVIIGGGPVAPPEAHGRVVNGSGYTQVINRVPESDGQAGQRIHSAGGDASGGSTGGNSGGVSSGGYSSGGGGDSGRTAVPR